MQPVTLVEGDRQTRFASVLTAEWLAELGLSGTAHTKRVPGWVFGTSRAERLAFLRGYLDSDGSVDKRGKVSYSSCNPDLIEDIRHLCMSLGIAVSNAYHRVGQTVLPNGQAGDVDQWTITCSDPAANRMIGSHNPRHQKRLDAGRGWDRKGKSYPFAKGRRSEPPAGCEYSRVVGIEYLLAEPVYDIEVEGTHNFVAAGLVVHNSNIREQHKNLYQDALGPWLKMIEEEIELQLLAGMADSDGVYCEFNIAEKLAGSFEEQVASLQSAVGVPWMTVNEARARMNLPSQKDGDGLATPLNMLPAGAVSALPEDDDEAADDDEEEPADDEDVNTRALSAGERKADGEIDPSQPELRRRHQEKWRQTLARTFSRQRDAVLGKFPKGLAPDGQKAEIADIWDSLRWDTELREDILRLNILTAGTWARYVTEQLDVELDEGLMRAWLEENARIAAEEINAYTRDQLAGALMEEEPRSVAKRIFDIAVDVRAIQIATTAVTRAIGFGSTEGARQGGLKTKTWIVNSKTPRPSHAALNGVTVGIRELFPGVNMRWPGDPAGGAAEVANCSCTVRFGR